MNEYFNKPVAQLYEDEFNVVAYRMEYFEVFKDIHVTLLLSQMHYWYSPIIKGPLKGKSKLRVQKDGQWYLVKSHEEWTKETGLTEKQILRAMRILVEAGVINIRILGFAGSPTRHISAINVKGNIPLQDGEFLVKNIPHKLPVGNLLVPYKEFTSSILGTTNTEITTETTTEKDLATANALPKDENPVVEEITEGLEMAKGPTSTTSILKHAKTLKDKKEGTHQEDSKVTHNTLQTIWRTCVDGTVPAFTQKQIRHFKNILARVPDHQDKVLRYTLENWIEWTQYVETSTGIKHTPLKPTLEYLLKNCALAYDYYIDKASSNLQLIAQPHKQIKTEGVLSESVKVSKPKTLAELSEEE